MRQKIIIPFLILLSFTIIPSYGQSIVQIQKPMDVPISEIRNMAENIQNYKIFPKNIKSIEVLKETENSKLVKIEFGSNGIFINTLVRHIEITDTLHRIDLLSGDLEGTVILASFEKTWGYDGTPGEGTIVNMKVIPRVSGVLSFFGIVSDDLIRYSIDTTLFTLENHLKNHKV
ncbi:MAG: hypothetical protein GWN01_16145 [Nitrosopumilaceae archaeon]|nr:hypothetical protein [Nitrosopumilaceae archaeon]NIU02369.1 hypothetical protein [Nitrosopumilaceae archaeon]NIU88826.1 hypothetical protein [Nitrosopumilaceae archaeon]NIV66951.1 hypothetical protein [Nitrosopumilaceae archaeon]NIX62970.1 hypothetical protein [Nitrosopumilaceae archaeon]